MKTCVSCAVEIGKYKCPICLVYYCSVGCCRKHRENKCEVALPSQPESTAAQASSTTFETPDAVPGDKLESLKDSSEVKDLLANPHLRDLLQHIDNHSNPEEVMDKAMQEPLFVEFTEACLKVIEPPEK